jgi:hypothetical protein
MTMKGSLNIIAHGYSVAEILCRRVHGLRTKPGETHRGKKYKFIKQNGIINPSFGGEVLILIMLFLNKFPAYYNCCKNYIGY